MSSPAELAAAALDAAQPIVTKPAGGGSTASWITAVCATLSALVGGFYVFWPKMRALGNKRQDNLDEERRGDMAALREEVRELRKTMSEREAVSTAEAKELRGMIASAVDTANAAETRSAILRAVVSMLTAEIQRMEPGNPVLQQAQAMIQDASSGDLGMGRGLRDIARKVAEVK